MLSKTHYITIDDYDYSLPDDKIAKYPLPQRDESKLLVYRSGTITEDSFKNIPGQLPEQSLIIFNNTKVIHARLLFRKDTGARIELFCLEPALPDDYAQILQENVSCRWRCMVGNSKKWKTGLLRKEIEINGIEVVLEAHRIESSGETHLIEFTWNDQRFTFGELLDTAGILPIPPYLHRETEKSDRETYQTVYSRIKGSVAAPTAGLHFTPEVLSALDHAGFMRKEVTLHVGTGTFKPVKTETIGEHEMHTEFITVERDTIEQLLYHNGRVIAVGTTSVRTLESLYYIGCKIITAPDCTPENLTVGQWMPYEADYSAISAEVALKELLSYMEKRKIERLTTSTRIMIAPGYTFKIVKGIITNFHQPKSTLLLLISSFLKGNWKQVYDYALNHNFRFLSYGDSSLLIDS